MLSLVKYLNCNLEKNLCVGLMSAIAVVLGIQVFMRYCMHQLLGWSEEFARYCFVWLVFVGISYGALMMKHITIDAFLLVFPKAMRKYVTLSGQLLFLVFSIWILALAWQFMARQYNIGLLSPSMRIPMWIVYAAPVVGFALTSVRVIQAMVHGIKHLHDPSDEE